MRFPSKKLFFTAAHDIAMSGLSFVLSFWLRLGEDFNLYSPDFLKSLIVFILISTIVLFSFGIYRRVWRYSAMEDLISLTKAVTVTILIFLPLMFLLNRLEGIPRTIMFINWFVMLALLGGPRFLYRMIKDSTLSGNVSAIPKSQKISVLLVGANDNMELFLRETVSNSNSDYRVVGIIDNDKGKEGRYIRNIRVYGSINNIEKVVEQLKKKGNQPQKIIIAPDLLEGDDVSKLLDFSERSGITMSRLPRLTDFKQIDAEKIQMRPIALEDLLGRPQKALDRVIMKKLVNGRRILITGAGGAIGSELVQQIAGYGPSHITILDSSEHNLYLIDRTLEETFPTLSKCPVIGDVRDRKNLDIVLKKERPSLVFHAAALKHVPMSEKNICEAVLTNIVGTKNMSDACAEAGVEQMVMISTDKAVNPSNVMGATKRLAENYVNSFGSSKKAKKTRFVTVRFGNVLGSSGSVIPLFQRQLEGGGPITVTHPDVTRYFMTIREAVELVLEASALAYQEKNKTSHIFVLDMGKPVLIKHLAEQMIRLAGLKLGEQIEIKYIGMRPGEKMFEELFYSKENPTQTAYEGIMLAKASEINLSDINKIIKKIYDTATTWDNQKSKALLEKALPEYKSD